MGVRILEIRAVASETFENQLYRLPRYALKVRFSLCDMLRAFFQNGLAQTYLTVAVGTSFASSLSTSAGLGHMATSASMIRNPQHAQNPIPRTQMAFAAEKG